MELRREEQRPVPGERGREGEERGIGTLFLCNRGEKRSEEKRREAERSEGKRSEEL